MLLELLHEMLNEFSPFYLYLSAIISVFYLNRIYIGVKHNVLENHFYIRKWHDVQIQLLPEMKIIPRVLEMRNWITTKTKRIEAPDDDTDAPSFSFNHMNKLRGGQQWKQQKNLYSLSLKNIASF
ncbi:hypothetical protein SAMN05216389_103165 [Oceanobacillus limi]|uniref:Uncharacterized protein n=1 Tax=Oceanobacillus limi TaxID=930131 RepID=A0A1I0AE49_9BACI|nr:hypothetical protein [Oceanobacillus limi]SES91528.1 hypothetical protein SAMN05216389_103165 [Oceanobacillus limi]